MQIENPKRRIVEDLKIRNKDNMRGIAGEYFGSKFTYAQTFKMFEDYKKAFIAIDGLNEGTITISAPSTIASVNAFYGALDANKVVNMTGPGFLHAYTEQYTTRLNSKTVVMFDSFLSDDLVAKFQAAGVKNLIVTSITDYMNPLVMVTEGRKNNAVISFNDDEEDEPPLHIGDVIGLTELQQFFPNLLKNENQNGIITTVDKCGKKSSLDAILHRLQSNPCNFKTLFCRRCFCSACFFVPFL